MTMIEEEHRKKLMSPDGTASAENADNAEADRPESPDGLHGAAEPIAAYKHLGAAIGIVDDDYRHHASAVVTMNPVSDKVGGLRSSIAGRVFLIAAILSAGYGVLSFRQYANEVNDRADQIADEIRKGNEGVNGVFNRGNQIISKLQKEAARVTNNVSVERELVKDFLANTGGRTERESGIEPGDAEPDAGTKIDGDGGKLMRFHKGGNWHWVE